MALLSRPPKLVRRLAASGDCELTTEDIRAVLTETLRTTGIPIVEAALERREIAVKDLLQQAEDDARDLEKLQATMDFNRQQLKELEITRAKQKQEQLDAKLQLDNLKKTQEKKLKKEQKLLEKVKTETEKATNQLRLIKKELKLYAELEKELGLFWGGCGEDEMAIIACNKIHPHHPDDEYYLFFSKFEPFENEFTGVLHKAVPPFPGFATLNKAINSTTELRELFDLARQRWTHEASGRNTPRLATSGARISLGKRETKTPKNLGPALDSPPQDTISVYDASLASTVS